MKIGDRVIVKSEYLSIYDKDKCAGTIIDINKYEDIIGIEFDDLLHNGHSCNGKGKNGYCWNVGYRDVIIEDNIATFRKELDKITL